MYYRNRWCAISRNKSSSIVRSIILSDDCRGGMNTCIWPSWTFYSAAFFVSHKLCYFTASHVNRKKSEVGAHILIMKIEKGWLSHRLAILYQKKKMTMGIPVLSFSEYHRLLCSLLNESWSVIKWLCVRHQCSMISRYSLCRSAANQASFHAAFTALEPFRLRLLVISRVKEKWRGSEREMSVLRIGHTRA